MTKVKMPNQNIKHLVKLACEWYVNRMQDFALNSDSVPPC